MESPRFKLTTPAEVARNIAVRLKALRLAENWSRATLAARSGVTAASLKRLESSGKVSLGNLLKLADALHRLGEFDELLRPESAASIADLERGTSAPVRKRGRK